MRYPTPLSLLPVAALLLSACSQTQTFPARQNLTANPLYVYAEQSLLVEHLSTVEIDTGSGSYTTQKRVAQRAAQDAQALMGEGMLGVFTPGADDAVGHVLLLDGALYFSPDFVIQPGLDLHVYLTETVDPREGTFPDETAVDLGSLPTPFGSQSIVVPAKLAKNEKIRTVVIRDEGLNRLVTFAQLSHGE